MHHIDSNAHCTANLPFEQQCKRWAQEQGYDYHFSVDIDEYLVPREAGITVMDALDAHVLHFSQSVVDIPRLCFQVSRLEWSELKLM